MCGKEWSTDCESKDHREIEYTMSIGKKIEYCNDATRFLTNCGYAIPGNKYHTLEHENDYENFEKAIAYFESLVIDYRFTHHQVI